MTQELFDQLLKGSLDIMRLASSERLKVLALLLELEAELIALLNAEDLTNIKRRELNRVFANANITIANYYDRIGASIAVPDIAEYVAAETSYALEIGIGYEAIKLPRQDYFRSLDKDLLIQGSPQADWWRGQSADTAFKFKAQVRQGLVNSETNAQIIARIVGTSGEVGVMDTVKRNAASLVQTAVQSVANDARRETFQANDDLIKGIRQVSTLDGHTSLVCVSYSECEWDLNYNPIGPKEKQKPFNGGCPRHFNCRSLEVPITKTFKELGIDIPEPPATTRASSAGPVPVDTTFDGFLKRQGKAYQEEVLGPGRADLWRDGKITLRDLVNANGRPRSLEELIELAKKRGAR